MNELSSFGWLAEATVKGVLILLVAHAVALLLYRSSAASRHLVWALALIGLLVMPLLAAVVPQLDISVLPVQATTDGTNAGQYLRPIPSGVVSTEVPPGYNPADYQKTKVDSRSTDSARVPIRLRTICLHWSRWVTLAWAIGAAVATAPLLLGAIGVWRVRRQAARVIAPRQLAELTQVRRQLGISRPIVLLQSGREQVPMTWGTLRPRVLLPAGSGDWTADRVRMVLLITARAQRSSRPPTALSGFHPTTVSQHLQRMPTVLQ